MNAAVGVPTGSDLGVGTVGSKIETASYASAPTAPPVKRGMSSLGSTRRRPTNERSACSGSGASSARIGSSGSYRSTVTGRSWMRARPSRTSSSFRGPMPEERVPAEPLPALDGLEEVRRRRAVVEAQERPDGRLEVGRARRAQQQRVGVRGEPLRLGQAERITRCHVRRLR